jgi:Zn-dependent protease/predicted transcriptional regulator
MFGKGIRLFRLFGFSVELDLSWLIIAALVTWSLAEGYFPAYYPDMSAATYWWMGVIGALGLFISIVIHEFSHSLVARRYGLEMRGIRLFVFGGVAQMDEEPDTPRAEFMMAIAGPIASVFISAATYGVHVLGVRLGWITPATAVFFYLAWINAVLVVFNMIPAFPLDGGRVLRSALWKLRGNLQWATRVATYAGTGFAIFLIVMGVWSLFQGFFIGGMWWILLGLFLRAASESSYQQVVARRVLGHEPVERVMRTDVHSVPASISVEDLVENHVYRHHFKMFPVTDNGSLVGCVTTRMVKELPREEWPARTVRELAEPCSEENSISPQTDAMAALKKMTQDGRSRLLVVEDGQLRGIISLKDVSRLISLKLELGEEG